MKVYKLRHKPSGLFFIPSTGKGNLSLRGKVYTRRPNLERGEILLLPCCLRGRFDESTRKYYDENKLGQAIKKWLGDYPDRVYVKTQPDEWEIIEL